MKNFLKVALVSFVFIIIIGQSNFAAAFEKYVGYYSDGTGVYLLTESVIIKSYRPYSFTCAVRAGRNNLYYSFFPLNGSPYYRNNEGFSGYVFSGQSPVAANIYDYVVSHW